MRYPTIALGERNGAVRALQYGLHRALAAKDEPHVNLRNGAYGDLTRQDVNRFKAAYGITPHQGLDFGGDGEWRALEPFLGKWDKVKLRARNAAIAAERARALAVAAAERAKAREKTVTYVALKFYAARRDYFYRQARAYPPALFSEEAHNRLDCSSSSTLIFKEAKAPDPNGRGYDGYGWTGSLWPRGVDVGSDAQAGDLAFYGHQSPGDIPSHVAVCISADEVVSFGHTPVERYPLRYRSDFRGCRRYPLK